MSVSDTPRTDAVVSKLEYMGLTPHSDLCRIARQFERDLLEIENSIQALKSDTPIGNYPRQDALSAALRTVRLVRSKHEHSS
jgi:hypothetical protein